MQINVINRQKSLSLPIPLVKRIVKSVIENEGVCCDEVSIYFVSTKEISKLHKQFFDDPTPTDCISFPIDGIQSDKQQYYVLGDVFVCPETAIQYAREKKGDAKQEIILYIIHGLLHLMGYDDMESSDRKRMRQAERKHLKRLDNKS